MNVLFIGKRFYTNRDALLEKYGRIYQLPWHWSQAGHAATLWLVDYHSTASIQSYDGSLRVTSTPVRNLALLRHWMSGAYRPKEPMDLVVASGDCYIGWMGLRVARRLGARFAFDVYDKYDEFGGYVRPLGFDLFSYLLAQADMRLFASRALMQDMQRAPTDCLVPNGLDVQRFRPADMQASRTAMALPLDTLLVGYFGSMEPERGVVDLIDAVSLLRERGMAVKLVLGGRVTPGLEMDRPGVLYLGNVPYERMTTALAACDLLAVPYRRSSFMDAGASNKIAEAIACRRPLVATRTPNLLANFPEQAQQLDAVLAEPGNVESLALSIECQAEQRMLVELPAGMGWPDISAHVIDKLASAQSRRTPLVP